MIWINDERLGRRYWRPTVTTEFCPMSGQTNGVLPLLTLVLLLLGVEGLRTAKAADPAAGQAVFRAQCGICQCRRDAT
jgi:hypothetical protein